MLSNANDVENLKTALEPQTMYVHTQDLPHDCKQNIRNDFGWKKMESKGIIRWFRQLVAPLCPSLWVPPPCMCLHLCFAQ